MRFVISLRALAVPGGLPTFVLTLAEHLEALGHEVVLFAHCLGLVSDYAQQRGLMTIDKEDKLPAATDATIACDKVTSIEMARRFPKARRMLLMHNYDNVWWPPAEPGIVQATLAPNDRLATLARGCAGAGKIVRIRQPIDLYRFMFRGIAAGKPRRILLLGNSGNLAKGYRTLQAAWSRPDLEWHHVGWPRPVLDVASEIAKADIVVGYGRSILEAMACGRPAYVYDHAGSDGWVCRETYELMESNGFSGMGVRPEPSFEQLQEDFLRYDPGLGGIGHGLARSHHDARLIAAEIAATANDLAQPDNEFDPKALTAIRNLAVLLYRANRLMNVMLFSAPQDRHQHAADVDALSRDIEKHVPDFHR